MVVKNVITLLICLFCLQEVSSQELTLEPYQFISRKKDTVQAELGTFWVPENRTQANSRKIQLSFVRFKSTHPNPGNPIVYLAGGPGGSGISTAKGRRFELFMKLREVADVIAFDQRGTGMSSNDLPNCPHWESFNMKKAIDKSEYVDKTTKSIAKCYAFWKDKGIEVDGYNTTENAKDIDALREMLNTDQISLWGISYGSHLAFEYIRLFEKNLDKVVLASLEGSDHTVKLPKATERFVFKLAELSKENYGAEITYPDLKNKIIAVHKRVAQEPVKASFMNRRGAISTIEISNFELQIAIASSFLKNPRDSKRLPKLYSQMYEGDFSGIARYVSGLKWYLSRSPRLMQLSMDLQSSISKKRAALVKQQIDESILGSTINFLLFEWMMQTDFPELPKAFRKMKSNKVNALLLSGTLDGRTYVEDGIEIAKKFKKGTHVIIENAGHDLYMQSPLVGQMVLDFFQGKSINSSVLKLPPIIFD
jgi:pimeloyl-ACP methyl ester carboxylesterase